MDRKNKLFTIRGFETNKYKIKRDLSEKLQLKINSKF